MEELDDAYDRSHHREDQFDEEDEGMDEEDIED